jgi:uncharacterized protein YeaC (DUF1315 family)
MSAPIVTGSYGLNDAATSPYLMEHMGREIRIARAIAEIDPDARPLITRIEIQEWPDGTEPQAGLPYRIVAEYDPGFAQFVFTLGSGPETDGKDRVRLAKKTSVQLRALYWKAVQNSHEGREGGDAEAHTVAERDKRLILEVLAGRGEKVTG